MAGGPSGFGPADHAGRIIGERRRLEAHQEFDGVGIQHSVDLDFMLLEAGIRPEDADGLADEEIRVLLDPGGGNTPPNHTPERAPGPKAA